MLSLQYAFTKALYVSIIIPLIFSCTFSTTTTKMPVFSVDQNTIYNDLKTLINYENVQIYGTETKTSGRKTSVCMLNIAFINSTNIPGDSVQCRELGKKVAKQIKQVVKNSNEFNAYRVFFVSRKVNGLVTTSSSIYYFYKPAEL